LAVESFAPWNLLVSYVKILTISNEASSEFPALRPFEPFGQFEDANKHLTNEYSLTRGAPFYVRPITGLVDLLLHVLSDAGPIGFLFAAVQLALGAGLMLVLGARSEHGFYYYAVGLPLGSVALASVAAIPLWLVAFLGVLAFNALAGI